LAQAIESPRKPIHGLFPFDAGMMNHVGGHLELAMCVTLLILLNVHSSGAENIDASARSKASYADVQNHFVAAVHADGAVTDATAGQSQVVETGKSWLQPQGRKVMRSEDSIGKGPVTSVHNAYQAEIADSRVMNDVITKYEQDLAKAQGNEKIVEADVQALAATGSTAALGEGVHTRSSLAVTNTINDLTKSSKEEEVAKENAGQDQKNLNAIVVQMKADSENVDPAVAEAQRKDPNGAGKVE